MWSMLNQNRGEIGNLYVCTDNPGLGNQQRLWDSTYWSHITINWPDDCSPLFAGIWRWVQLPFGRRIAPIGCTVMGHELTAKQRSCHYTVYNPLWGKGEKFSAWPTIDLKLVCCRRCPWMQTLRPRKLYHSVALIQATVRLPTQRPFLPCFTSVVG